MIRGLRELADYWDADTEESQQIIAAISEIERLRKEANNLERFSTDHLVYELMRRDEETGGDTE